MHRFQLRQLDDYLLSRRRHDGLRGVRRFAVEFLFFGIKEARACLFAGLFFAAVFMVPRAGLLGIPRYDVLFLFAVAVQAWMVRARLETVDELKAITLFHVIGFALEAFKTSSGIQSWIYPEAGYTKLFGVPLFSGFMYAAIGSYITQAWKMLALRIEHHPPYWMAGLLACLIYANFFTHHYMIDIRVGLFALSAILFGRSWFVFTPDQTARRMPMLMGFVLVSLFIWFAENLGTFAGAWIYPSQADGWHLVPIEKMGAWYLLMLISFVLVTLVHRPVDACVARLREGIWRAA